MSVAPFVLTLVVALPLTWYLRSRERRILLAAGIVSLPILALFIMTQRYFIRSAMGGALKM